MKRLWTCLALLPLVSAARADLLRSRSLSWDAVGLVPVFASAKPDDGDTKLMEQVESGETGTVARLAIQRLRLDPNDRFAAWVYVQCARIRGNASEADGELERSVGTIRKSAPVAYAHLKLKSIAAKASKQREFADKGFIMGLWQPETEARELAKHSVSIWPDSLEVLAGASDVFVNDALASAFFRAATKRYVSSHPDDERGSLVLARSFLSANGAVVWDGQKPDWVLSNEDEPDASPERSSRQGSSIERMPKRAAHLVEAFLKAHPKDVGARYLHAWCLHYRGEDVRAQREAARKEFAAFASDMAVPGRLRNLAATMAHFGLNGSGYPQTDE